MSPEECAPALRPLKPRPEYVQQSKEKDVEPCSVRGIRSPAACTECRRRRIKCNGYTPCEPCTLHNRECVIDLRHDKRKKTHLRELEQELQYYRTFIHQLYQVIGECDDADVNQLVSLIRDGGTKEDIKNTIEGYLQDNTQHPICGESSGKDE
ncbi:hypothetical protein BDV38DRAFT_266347 [Aspergillus pseudotamarii]|uniref:Zn(2)-C6 fungal-type domain-containing protein n=1 Tax=Aspergillus pseudotamarii TaxID=132259 RepID=A0A5N6S7X2_ASPPS|nr:uncharacterized protein BDV38DRAFT_266347 [Aspergillus pseudotamarii]KAE8130758.1 hypothetical protein BDV38DRAFT_266347 [Aspergillus pseudotamarii]